MLRENLEELEGRGLAPYLSWTRAAYVFFVLAVLAALLKLGGAGLAQQRILDSEPTDPATTIELTSPENTTSESTNPENTSPETTTAERTQIEEAPAPAASSSIQRAPKPTRQVPVKRTITQKKSASEKAASVGEPPVFYRPSTRAAAPGASGKASAPAATGPVCGDLGNFPKSSKAVFPLSNLYFNSYDDTWGAPRPQGSHEGTDLMTPAGTQEYAVTDGTVVPVSGANGNGWNTLGGYTLMLRADYDVGPIEAGDLFYYAHMEKPSALEIGTRVRAGQVIGFAGDTGQGPEVTSGLFPPHLHFGWYDSTGVRTSLDSGAMNPFPLLEWLKTNGGSVAGGSDAEYCKAPQIGPPVPSSGGDTWSYPSSPGVRPDLDTGSDDGRPSPVVEVSASSAERAPGAEKDNPDADKPDADRPVNQPANRPEEDQEPNRPVAKPRPPETTAPAVEPPDVPNASIEPETPKPSPKKPPAANPESIGRWVDGLIATVTGSPDNVRPTGKPVQDGKPKKPPKKHKKQHPKKVPPERPKPKPQQRPTSEEETVCADPGLRDPRTGEACEKTTAQPGATPPEDTAAEKDTATAEDASPPEPDAGESTPSETTTLAPDPPPTDLKEAESGSEPTSEESTTLQ